MSYPIDRGFGYPGSPYPVSVEDLAEEMVRARKKFPGNAFLLAACMEELGELAEAILLRKGTHEERGEALQVACVAMRLYEEGDSAYDEIRGTLPEPLEEARYTALIWAVGELGRALLQRKPSVGERCAAIAELVQSIGRDGDPMFANLTDAQAKP